MQRRLEPHWLNPRYSRELRERCRQIEAEPLPSSTAALLDEAAAEVPERVALDFFESGERLTYRELRTRVNRLASSLHRIGVHKGTHVAVMLPNAPEFPITWLALGRLGAVMVPVNIGYTGRELDYLVNDAAIEYLVIADPFLPVLEAMEQRPAQLAGERVIDTSAWRRLQEEGHPEFISPTPVGLDDLCNIQYTSGTTGFPKGCLLAQRYWITTGKINATRDGLALRAHPRLHAVLLHGPAVAPADDALPAGAPYSSPSARAPAASSTGCMQLPHPVLPVAGGSRVQAAGLARSMQRTRSDERTSTGCAKRSTPRSSAVTASTRARPSA